MSRILMLNYTVEIKTEVPEQRGTIPFRYTTVPGLIP